MYHKAIDSAKSLYYESVARIKLKKRPLTTLNYVKKSFFCVSLCYLNLIQVAITISLQGKSYRIYTALVVLK